MPNIFINIWIANKLSIEKYKIILNSYNKEVGSFNWIDDILLFIV